MVRGARALRSGSKDNHSASTEAALRDSPGTDVAVARQNPGLDRPSPAGVSASAAGQQGAGESPPAAGKGSRRALKNWRVRSRLFLLIIIPTITAMVFGGLRIASSVQSDQVDQRVEVLANLSGNVTGLVQALQNEREDTVSYIVLGSAFGGRGASKVATGPEIAVLQKDYAASTVWAGRASALLQEVGSSYPSLTQQDAASALTAISGLKDLRIAAIQSKLPALVVVQEYANSIDTLLALDSQIAVGSNDGTLADTVRAASLISATKEEASEQQAILTSALAPGLAGLGQFGASQQSAITNAQAEQQGDLAEFNSVATAAQAQLYHNATSGTTVSNAAQQEQQAISAAASGASSAADGGVNSTTGLAVENAVAATSYLVSSLRFVEQHLVSAVIARSKTLRSSAITSVIIDSIAVILALVIALLLTTLVGRSLVRPLRRLRIGALEVAGVRLPEAVRRMSETDGESVSLDVQPIDVDSSDEIGQVARAFDQVHREALRLAATEAALRGNVNAMFVNLSRRSQSLVERQIKLIDELEQGEQDSERLSSLFRMDHLATRMRRNSENLLVLAGHDASRHWNQPVAVVDVLRAAVSEIEQYERVTLNVQPGIAVRGQAVSDVVHLTAELVENATSFSAGETPVSIVGHLLSSGGVLLEIADQGVGMGTEELAHANWRLDNPPAVDVAVSRRMGLFVVARLAARHGIRVRLRLGPSGGLTALVWLPDEAVTHENVGTSPGLTGFDARPAMEGSNGGAPASEWLDQDRSAAEQEVNAAWTPRFAPLADAADTGSLGPRRVPGAGLRPGGGGGRLAAAATGPLPAFRTTPQPSPRGAEPFAAAPQPVAGGELGTAPQPVVRAAKESVWNIGTEPAAEVVADSSASSEPSRSALGRAGASPPVTSAEQFRSSSGSDWTPGSSSGGVLLPPPGSLGEENRLPIFEAVESDWFRRGRHAVSLPSREERVTASSASASSPGASSSGASSSGASSSDGNGWSSAADAGWRAAEAASAPSSGGITPAGLPKRVPQANLVPGTAAETPAPVAPRSAAATRERFASLQRGIREGRAAVSGEEAAGGEDESSK